MRSIAGNTLSVIASAISVRISCLNVKNSLLRICPNSSKSFLVSAIYFGEYRGRCVCL